MARSHSCVAHLEPLDGFRLVIWSQKVAGFKSCCHDQLNQGFFHKPTFRQKRLANTGANTVGRSPTDARTAFPERLRGYVSGARVQAAGGNASPVRANLATSATSASENRPRSSSMADRRCRNCDRFSTGNVFAASMTVCSCRCERLSMMGRILLDLNCAQMANPQKVF
jgi:hypothetical protein